MNDLENNDMDYEIMDDLPLADRIEFNHLENEHIPFDEHDEITNWLHG